MAGDDAEHWKEGQGGGKGKGSLTGVVLLEETGVFSLGWQLQQGRLVLLQRNRLSVPHSLLPQFTGAGLCLLGEGGHRSMPTPKVTLMGAGVHLPSSYGWAEAAQSRCYGKDAGREGALLMPL